jgi:hypothetical protein
MKQPHPISNYRNKTLTIKGGGFFVFGIFILKYIMRNIINEELGRMKNLFGYKRGMVISEQAATLPPSNAANFPTTIPAAPTDPWVNFPCVTGNKNAVKGKLTNGSIAYTMNKVTYYSNGRKRLSDGTMANFTCNDAEFKSVGVSNPATTAPPTTVKNVVVPIPKELKDADGIKKFQDWLDVNVPGWATGYQGGILNKGNGYGRFGKRTQTAWKSYSSFYIKSLAATAPVTPVAPATQKPGVETKFTDNRASYNNAFAPVPQVPAAKTPVTPNTVGPAAVGDEEYLNSLKNRG